MMEYTTFDTRAVTEPETHDEALAQQIAEAYRVLEGMEKQFAQVGKVVALQSRLELSRFTSAVTAQLEAIKRFNLA